MTSLDPRQLDLLLASLAARGHDFRDYRRETIERRAAERIAGLGLPDAAAYAARLADDPAEAARLADALLVPASAFFRDPPVFAALEHDVAPRLFAAARASRPVRAWVAGAATGEEAWSLAMTLEAACRPGDRFEIFASDLADAALAHAAAGRYEAARAAHVPPAARARWLEPDGAHVVVRAPLRAHVRFCRHDLVGPLIAPAEAVVASFELVLCRNVLIYFDARLQALALERLVAALAPGGVLALGRYDAPAGADRVLAPLPGAPRDLGLFVAAEAR